MDDSKLIQVIESISKVVGDTDEGYTGTEIDRMMKNIDENYDISKDKSKQYQYGFIYGKNKVDRIYNFGIYLSKKYNKETSIKNITEYYLAPGRWIKDSAKYEIKYKEINKILSLVGLQINKSGILQYVKATKTLDEVNEKWETFYQDLEKYNKLGFINTEILKYCEKEAKKNFYYHVVDQICKHLEEKIKKKLKQNQNDETKKAVDLLKEKVFIQKNQQPYFLTNNDPNTNNLNITTLRDYQNGYVLFIKGLLKLGRNVFSHTSRKEMNDINKEEAITLLISLSKAYDFIDTLNLIREN